MVSLFYIVGADFNPLMDPAIVFTSANSQDPICRPVTVINDSVSEETEVFLIEMSTSREHVALSNATQVTISDDDR